jgi:AbrB family looped-hinge helix DNA binding protein
LKVEENGQITIPANVVKSLNINLGQNVEIRLLPQNKIQLTPQGNLSSGRKLSPKKWWLVGRFMKPRRSNFQIRLFVEVWISTYIQGEIKMKGTRGLEDIKTRKKR